MAGIGITTPGTPTAEVRARDKAPSGNPSWVQEIEEVWTPITGVASGDREFTVTNSVKQFTNIPSDAQKAMISVEGSDGIRFWDEGSTPSATSGHILKPPTADAIFYFINSRDRITNFRMFRVTADATVRVTYFK